MSKNPNTVRDCIVACAVRNKRIAPGEEEEWRRMYDAAPLRVTDLLVPDRAQTPAASQASGVTATYVPVEAYPASWLGIGHGTGAVASDIEGGVDRLRGLAQPRGRITVEE